MAEGKKAAKALKDADKRHYNQVEKYVKVVDGLYTQAVGDLSALAVRIGLPEDDSAFEFPKSKQKEVQKVVKQLADRITATIMVGDRNEWNAACSKFDDFVETVLNTSKLSRKQLAKYEARNLEALSAFQQRKVDGLDLSERVWKTVQPFKDEVELAIDTATGEGKSAAELSRDVRSCLKDPDKLFRRVRDKYGNLHLSKAAKLYHPGQGVYRSSYKNAMRVTRSEINMAYRQSDHMRWQQLDFVVGIQVQTSNNHTCLGQDGKPHRFTDICDELAGKYPKDFKFVGWHPQCRCFATPILKTLDEVEEEIDEEGNYRDLPSVNEVKDVPDNFKQYIADNAARIEGWQSMPYYLKDNTERVVPGLCAVTDGQSHASIVSNRQLAAYLLGHDKHYKDVTFDAKTGGLKATHVDHNFDKVGGQYEKAVQEAGFKEGHAVILGSETGTTIGERYTEGLWDGQRFEVMGCETATDNNYLRGLCHCADKWTTEVAILHFPNGGFDKNKMRRAIGRYHGLEKLGDGQYLEFKSVVCIQDGKVVYNEAFKKGAGSSTFVVHPPHISKSGTANVVQKPEPTKTKEQLLAEQREKQRLLTLERAKKRHDARTKEQEKAIRSQWSDRAKIAEAEKELEKALKVTRGKPMTFEQANEMRANPHYKPETGYSKNCQSCVVANELRRRGYDVEAIQNTHRKGNAAFELSHDTTKAWIDPKTGMHPESRGIIVDRYANVGEDFFRYRFATPETYEPIELEPGRYHLLWTWHYKSSGHIITMEKLRDGSMRFYDPQTGKLADMKKILQDMERGTMKYYRVDNLMPDLDWAGRVVMKAGTTKASTKLSRYDKAINQWVSAYNKRMDKGMTREEIYKEFHELLKKYPDFEKDIWKAIDERVGMMGMEDVDTKVKAITAPRSGKTYVSFEPFSPILVEKLDALRDKKQKMALFKELAEDKRTEVLSEVGTAKTVMFTGHHGASTDSWKATKQMAADINKQGETVIFLPEIQGKTSADALVLFNGKPVVADFKYSNGTNWNTLQKDIAHGFDQADTVVLKLARMDAGAFSDTIEYLKRNGTRIGNIKLINRYGKYVELSMKDLQYGSYKKKIKGFL